MLSVPSRALHAAAVGSRGQVSGNNVLCFAANKRKGGL